MLENKENRTLIRLGARVLSPEEYDKVGGGFGTGLCTFNVKTHNYDLDCTPEPN